jgi:serine/threonine protein kinase
VIDLTAGTHLANYRIEELIGRGGMGVVYRAQHLTLGRKVAIKLLAPELARDESLRERFVRESCLAASIDHPNVIPIYEAGEDAGHYYIAMRYVEGVDLRQLLEQRARLEMQLTLLYLRQVAAALDAAHARGLVHRDVKPGNVLVEHGIDHCYLTDFGLTKAMGSTSGFTGSGQFVGTIDYIAPEQIEGKPLDARADVYSLGCIFHECLVGCPPFVRDTDMAVLVAHMKEPAPLLSAVRPDLPPGLDLVLATAMAKSREDRYPSCSSLMDAVTAAIRGYSAAVPQPWSVAAEPAPAPPTLAVRPAAYPHQPGAYGAVTYTESPAPYQPLPAAEPDRRGKPVTAIALVIAALLLAGGGTAAALIITGDKDEETSSQSDGTGASDDADSSDDGGDVKPSQPEGETGPIEKQPAPGETDPAPPPEDPAAEEAAAVEAVSTHWQLIADGDYGTAWEYFSSPQTTRDGFIRSHERDRIESVDYSFTATVDGDSAIAEVDYLVTVDRCGTKNWSGTYDMVKVSGQWLIDRSNLTDDNPDC